MDTTLTRRRFLVVLGGSAAYMVMSACSRDPDGAAGSVTSTTADLDVVQSIEVWDFDPTGIDQWVNADMEFDEYWTEKYPNVTVNRTQAGFAGFAEAFLTSVAGGATYDVVYGWAPWLSQFRENDVVVPLSAFLENDAEVSADSFHDYGKDVADGEIFGLSWYASAQFIYYNKSALSDAGLPDPAQLDAAGEWTYDSFRELAENASSGGSQPIYGFDMAATRGTGDYSAFARGWGTDLWGENFTRSLLDSDENIALWGWIRDFYRNKWTPLPTEGSGLAESLSFGDERILMFISGANYFRTADQQGVPDKFDIGLVRIPKGPGGQSSVSFNNSYFMGAGGQNQATGWAWYKERTFSERARELYVDVGASRFPVRKDQSPVTAYDWEDPDLYERLREDMYAVVVVPQQTRFDELYGTAWDNLILESEEPDTLLTQLAADATLLLNE